MTTYYVKDVTCANCNRSSQHDVLGSTNTFGSPDLDLRPAEMQRSTMRAWLQVCPHCHYVAGNLSVKAGDLAVVAGAEYQATMNDKQLLELARRFLAHALLFIASDSTRAGHARLNAAWVCDDARQIESAKKCRALAGECFVKSNPFADNESGLTQWAIYVDVLRRADQMELAGAECDALLKLGHAQGLLREILEYQRRLIGKCDTAARRVDERVR